MNTLRARSTRCLAVLLPAALAVGGAWAQVAAPAAPAQAAPASAAPAQTMPAPATTATVAPAVALPVRTLAPFDARYAVFRDGKPLGDASLQLVSLANARWRVDLHIEATHGLLGFAPQGFERRVALGWLEIRDGLQFARRRFGIRLSSRCRYTVLGE